MELNKAYASALFSLAREAGNAAEIGEGLKTLTQIFAENPEYGLLLASPSVPKTERTALVHQAFDGKLPEDLISFLLLLCSGGHLKELDACAEEYEFLYQASLRVATAEVCSAMELTEEQKQKLQNRLESLSGKQVTLSCTVDPTLVGGLTVALDGKVYDGSLRRRMDDIKKVMEQ
ncbi:MAG: ATP synthase F1 subunit delta [Clostridia bacterium]|nr:ATP synthase F1 subunit delta [Clostridia bacterium]